MSNDVIVGEDGMTRCGWAGPAGPLARYHDEVWGTPTLDERALFEALTLGVFQAGLSWRVVFGKREGFREAFHDFDVAKVAAMGEGDVARLIHDASIVRNRAKIQATLANARVVNAAEPSLAALVGSCERADSAAPRSLAEIPVSTPQAESLAKQMKMQGYRFVGPTSVYAFMQNVGVVNDHVRGCFRASARSSRTDVR
jgi:DNA-3-methyladenine glycosylase I